MLDLRTLSTVTDFFVVCTTGSAPQAAAIQEHVEAILRHQGCPVGHIEGASAPAGRPEEPHWLLMDCGDVVIHVFDHPARTFYRLEHLWADAPQLPLAAIGVRGAGSG